MTARLVKRIGAAVLLLLAAALAFLLLLAGPAGRPGAPAGKAAKPSEMDVEVQIERAAPAAPTVPTAPATPAPPRCASAEATPGATGSFPPIWSSYREQVGFNAYADELERRGAVFFLQAEGGWYAIDRAQAALRPFDVARIGSDFGANPNCIEDEPALSAFVAKDAGTVVFLAKPLAMETRIQSSIRHTLQARGISLADATGIRAVYDYVGGQFCLVVSEVATKAGGIQPLPMTIPL